MMVKDVYMVKTRSLFDMTGVERTLFDALDIGCQYSFRFLLGRESIFSEASNFVKHKTLYSFIISSWMVTLNVGNTYS